MTTKRAIRNLMRAAEIKFGFKLTDIRIIRNKDHKRKVEKRVALPDRERIKAGV